LEKVIREIRNRINLKIKIAKNIQDIEKIKIESLGRKGELTLLLRKLGSLSKEDRPKIGKLLNYHKNEIEKSIQDRTI